MIFKKGARSKNYYTCDRWSNHHKSYVDDFRGGTKNGWNSGKVQSSSCSGSFLEMSRNDGDRMMSKTYEGLPTDAKGVKVEFDFLEIKNANERNNYHSFNKLDYTINGERYQLGRRSGGRERNCNRDHVTVHHVSITVNKPPRNGKVDLSFQPKINHAGFDNIIITPICYRNNGDGGHDGNGGSDNGGSHNSGSDNGGSHNSGSDNGGSHNSGSDNGGSHNSGSDNGGSHNSGNDNGGSHNSGN